MSRTRRSLLTSAGALALGAAAGCLDEPPGERAPDGGYAAFFALWDWAEAVSGEQMTFENPVPTGTMSHGWEPGGDLQRDIADTGVFVYLGTPEFRWARDTASQLEIDYEHVTLIDAMDGLDDQLLALDHDHAGENGHDHDGEDGHDHEDEHSHGEDDHSEDEHGDGHEHDQYDPHVWTDPVIAGEIVSTIADGIADADPDNADRYEENATAYRDRLADVDQQFETLVDETPRDVAILAGHDSFGYLERRYGFELRTPVGVSASAVETASDVSELIAVVEEFDIETVLYDPFAAADGDDVPRMVDVLLEDTDVTGAEPLTPAEGTTEAWAADGWGWVEQMERVNVPSLRAALGGE